MYHESLNILIQRRLSKFLLIDNFDPADSWKGFFGGISSPDELFSGKLNVNTTKDKERHA